MYKHGSLFSGIEGFGLAAHWMGWENKFHCEWNPFGRHINHYYWPEAESYNDITKTDFTIWRGRIDVLTGGFPCQPFSTAGKRKGTDDARYLWPEMLRAIREIRPRWVVGENVYGLVNWDGGLVFDTVCTDLENEGFEVWPVVLPAAGVNAPHRRDRIWFIAHNTKQGLQIRKGSGIKQGNTRLERRGEEQPSPNPHNGSFGEGPGQLQEKAAEIPQRDNDAEPGDTDTRPSENPNNDGWGGEKRQGEPSTREQRHTGAGDNERIPTNGGEAGILADTNGFGLRGEGDWAGNAGLFGENDAPNDWSAFPTVSPLCDGNDGISDILDFDAVRKVAAAMGKSKRKKEFTFWREESIKAGGNAIVPEVAFRLFRTMAAFDKLKG